MGSSLNSFFHSALLLALCAIIPLAAVAKEGDVHFSHDFMTGSQYSWTTWTSGPLAVTKTHIAKGRGFEASDASRWPWYFQAGQSFLGDRSSALGGSLRLHFGHRVYNSEGEQPVQDWDVIMEAKGFRLKIGIKKAFGKNYWGRIRQYDVPLVADGRWQWIANGTAVGRHDIAKTLMGLSRLRIRGGHFKGTETAVLLSASWVEGKPHQGYDTMHHKPVSTMHLSPTCVQVDPFKTFATSRINKQTVQFTDINPICSSAALTVRARGAGLLAASNFLILYDDATGTPLGRVFDSLTLDQSLPANSDIDFEDTVVLNADTMSRLTAGHTMWVRLATPGDSGLTGNNDIELVFASLKFKPTACSIAKVSKRMEGDLLDASFSVGRISSVSSDLSLAVWFSAPASQNHELHHVSVSLKSSNGSFVPFLSESPQIGSDPSSLFDNIFYATVQRSDVSQFVDKSTGQIQLKALAQSSGNEAESWKYAHFRIVGAASSCVVTTKQFAQWRRETPPLTGQSSFLFYHDAFTSPVKGVCPLNDVSCASAMYALPQDALSISVSNTIRPSGAAVLYAMGKAEGYDADLGRVTVHDVCSQGSCGSTLAELWSGTMPGDGNAASDAKCTASINCVLPARMYDAASILSAGAILDQSVMVKDIWTGSRSFTLNSQAVGAWVGVATLAYPADVSSTIIS